MKNLRFWEFRQGYSLGKILTHSLKYFYGRFTRAPSIVGAPESTFLQSGAHTRFEITVRQTGILDEKCDIEIEIFESFCKFVFEIARWISQNFGLTYRYFEPGMGAGLKNRGIWSRTPPSTFGRFWSQNVQSQRCQMVHCFWSYLGAQAELRGERSTGGPTGTKPTLAVTMLHRSSSDSSENIWPTFGTLILIEL